MHASLPKSTLLPRQRVISQILNNFSHWKVNSCLTFLFAQDFVILIVPYKIYLDLVYNDLDDCPAVCNIQFTTSICSVHFFKYSAISTSISKKQFQYLMFKKNLSFSSDTGTQSATHKGIVLNNTYFASKYKIKSLLIIFTRDQILKRLIRACSATDYFKASTELKALASRTLVGKKGGQS